MGGRNVKDTINTVKIIEQEDVERNIHKETSSDIKS